MALVDLEAKRVARAARAAARRLMVTGRVVAVGTPKDSPYAHSSPDERIAAAVRLIGYHEQLCGPRATVPRSEWPGEVFVSGSNRNSDMTAAEPAGGDPTTVRQRS